MTKFLVLNAGKLSILWTVVIFALCAMPGEYIPSQSWMDLLSVDKFVHTFIFFTLFTLIAIFSFKIRLKTLYFYLYLLACMLYGVSLEWMQAVFFRNRSFDYHDMIANAIGCLLALFFIERIKKTTQRYFPLT